MTLEITLFTDPACPFAFSAEPVRQRLRWHYGDALEWRIRMIVLTREDGRADRLAEGAPVAIPGLHPFEVYETAVANLAPELVRRPPAETVEEVPAWAGEPLATAEVAAIAHLDHAAARAALARVARPLPAGADCYWEPR